MINFKYIFIVIGLIMSYFFKGQDISEETAQLVAKNFLNLNSEVSKPKNVQLTNVTARFDKKYDGFYIFKNENEKGFCIISSESENHPVLAYSFDSPLSLDSHVSPEFLYILNGYQEANEYLRKNKANKSSDSQSTLIKEEWEALLSGKKISSDKNAKTALATSVSPLIKTTWDQKPYYNKFAPITYEGKKSYTGCVATAMAQIMKFWNYPVKGNSTHSYIISDYYYNWKGKTLTANFGNTTYLWNAMPNSLSGSSSTQQVDAVATLMLHAGISVNMIYSPSISGAYDVHVVPALKNYFKYSSDISIEFKSDYPNDTKWLNLIKEQVAKGYPVYFTGRTSSSGHAFIADGYDVNNLIHFNLGWGGYANGYYRVNDVCGYSNNQAVIINIVPTCFVPTGLTITYTTTNKAILEWDESDFMRYTVEYRASSETNWTVAAASTNRNYFMLSGLKPNTTYYWRVKVHCSAYNSSAYTESSFSTNSSLRRDISKDPSLNNDTNESTFISVYPNPVENTVYIKGLNSDKEEYVLVTIVDGNGRIVKTFNCKKENIISIDVSDLSPSIYFITISGKSYKFIKN